VILIVVESPKLSKFQQSLAIDRNQQNLSVVKKIDTLQEGVLAISFLQEYEIDMSGETPIASLQISETYPTLDTNEFDVSTKYTLHGSTMTINRIVAGQEMEYIISNSSIEVFWEIVDDNNTNEVYSLDSQNFNNLQMSKYALSAKIVPNRLSNFFNDISFIDANNATLDIILNKSFGLKDLKIQYDTILAGKPSQTIVTVEVEQELQSQFGEMLIRTLLIIAIGILLLFNIIFYIRLIKNKKAVAKNSIKSSQSQIQNNTSQYNAPSNTTQYRQSSNIPLQNYNQPYQQTSVRQKSSNTQNLNPNPKHSQYNQTNLYFTSQNQPQVRNIKDNSQNKSNKRNK
jgi:hypothetical protein